MPDIIPVIETSEAPPEDDEFSQAFAQLSVANDAARGGEAPPKLEPAPEVVGEETSLPDETRKAEAAPEPAPEPPKPVVPPKFSDEELARFAAIAQQVAKPAPQPPPVPQVQQEVSPYNQDEIALINEYMTEYPEIARAEALSRRKDIFDAVRYVLGEVNRALGPTVQEVNRIAQRTHVGDLQQLVPDYNITREQAIEWTQKQPAYLQPAYYHVIHRGTPEEIAHFTQLYRASQFLRLYCCRAQRSCCGCCTEGAARACAVSRGAARGRCAHSRCDEAIGDFRGGDRAQ